MGKLLGWFVAGAMTTLLIAANSGTSRLGDEPELTSAFTYHGQLKSGGDPYSGLADVRLTLWNDAFTGVQVGRTVDFEGVAVEDGLFAVEPDFGPDAFNGARRWIEVAVRAPAGSGGYLTLDPRQAVNATPYALYALNGTPGPKGPPGDSYWELDPKTGDISITNRSIEINQTDSAPALSVFHDIGGDDSVALPASSIGPGELAGGLSSARSVSLSASSPFGSGPFDVGSMPFFAPHDGIAVISISGSRSSAVSQYYPGVSASLNGVGIPLYYSSGPSTSYSGTVAMPVSQGINEIVVTGNNVINESGAGISMTISVIFCSDELE